MPVRALGAPHTTCTGCARAGIDHANPELIGVGMLLGRDDISDRKAGQLLGAIFHPLDLEADAGERGNDLVKPRLGFEVVLEPGKREFHRKGLILCRPCR
jgi:hypothetical protein